LLFGKYYLAGQSVLVDCSITLHFRMGNRHACYAKFAMKKTSLKLHLEGKPEELRPRVENSRTVVEVCRSFEMSTGWQLRYERLTLKADAHAWSQVVSNIQQQPVGRLSLAPSAEFETSRIPLAAAQQMASALGELLGELESAKHTVWEREAELAAGVPITSRPNEKQHLAQRLEGILQGGANALGCHAAGLYLLDDATTELKLRSLWGLPRTRLMDAPRQLKGSVADLEALVGHAVVIENVALLPQWPVPEKCVSAICVPVGTATIPLGTLWFFCDVERDFNAQETNIAELVAGRLAADLEREMLLNEGVRSKQVKKQWANAIAWQKQRLPAIAPCIDGWQVAGWTQQAEGIGGDFYDWNVHNDGRLLLTVGDAQGSLLSAGFTAAVTQSAVRSHSLYKHNARELLQKVNDTMWTSSAGDEFASLFHGLIDPETGNMECSLAGSLGALIMKKGQHELITTDTLPLGADPDASFSTWRRTLLVGDFLVIMSEGVRNARDAGGLQLGEVTLATLLRRIAQCSAQEIVRHIREMLQYKSPDLRGQDRTLLVIKRKQ
jgi:phosphoserine phosphatase RsbU/P